MCCSVVVMGWWNYCRSLLGTERNNRMDAPPNTHRPKSIACPNCLGCTLVACFRNHQPYCLFPRPWYQQHLEHRPAYLQPRHPRHRWLRPQYLQQCRWQHPTHLPPSRQQHLSLHQQAQQQIPRHLRRNRQDLPPRLQFQEFQKPSPLLYPSWLHQCLRQHQARNLQPRRLRQSDCFQHWMQHPTFHLQRQVLRQPDFQRYWKRRP